MFLRIFFLFNARYELKSFYHMCSYTHTYVYVWVCKKMSIKHFDIHYLYKSTMSINNNNNHWAKKWREKERVFENINKKHNFRQKTMLWKLLCGCMWNNFTTVNFFLYKNVTQRFWENASLYWNYFNYVNEVIPSLALLS